MSKRIRTHYDNLQVARTASTNEIIAACRRILQKQHPDKSNKNKDEAEKITKLILEARDVLIDPVKRAKHDQWIEEQSLREIEKEQEIRRRREAFEEKKRNQDIEAKRHAKAEEDARYERATAERIDERRRSKENAERIDERLLEKKPNYIFIVIMLALSAFFANKIFTPNEIVIEKSASPTLAPANYVAAPVVPTTVEAVQYENITASHSLEKNVPESYKANARVIEQGRRNVVNRTKRENIYVDKPVNSTSSLPENAHINSGRFRGWECNNGFYQINERCEEIQPTSIPDQTKPAKETSNSPARLDCDLGYRQIGNECVVLNKPYWQ